MRIYLSVILSFIWLAFTSFLFVPGKVIFKTATGTIHFISVAPLETIKASSKELKGIIDTSKNTFAFSVEISSFKGFNSPLQQEHFNENYMESTRFPQATFTGKIIEIIDFTADGTYQVRAKGIMDIHGVKSERIIRSTVEVKNNEMKVKSSFKVNLQEHNIKIPRIVFQKISPDIEVSIVAVLNPVQI